MSDLTKITIIINLIKKNPILKIEALINMTILKKDLLAL
jgi:hypothetical protein